MIINDGNIKYVLDNRLVKELNWGIELCTLENDDFVIIIDGSEGAGKSYLSRQIAHYIAFKTKTPFGIDNIHFDSNSYQEFSEEMDSKKNKGLPIILDESRSSLNRKRAMSKKNVQFTNFFSECRSSNQVHIVVLPFVHDLDSYIALCRVKLIINVHKYVEPDSSRESGKKLVRGKYVLINPSYMQRYIDQQHKYGKYNYPKYNVQARCEFNNVEILQNPEEYEDKKKEWRKKKQEEADTVNLGKRDIWFNKAIKFIVREAGMSQKACAEMLGCDPSTVSLQLKTRYQEIKEN